MEEFDRQLVASLTEDGRMTNKAIATRLGTSEARVASRLRNLLQTGAIRIVAQHKIMACQSGLIAIIQLHLDAPGKIEEVVQALRADDAIFIVYETARRPELCAYARVNDLAALHALVLTLGGRGLPISSINVLPVLAHHRTRHGLANLEAFSHNPKATPRDVEEALIQELEQDGRQPVRTLAAKIGLSETATRYRLEKLLRRGDIEIRLVTDAARMGYSIWADIRVKLAPSGIQPTIDALASHPDVISISHLSGEANLMVFVVARTVTDLDDLVRQHIRTIAGMDDFTIMRVVSVLKYDPNIILA